MRTPIPATLKSYLKTKKVVPIEPFLAPLTERSYKAAYEQACEIIKDREKLVKYIIRLRSSMDPHFDDSMAKIRVFHYREDGSVDEHVEFLLLRSDAPTIVDKIQEALNALKDTAPKRSPRSPSRSPDK